MYIFVYILFVNSLFLYLSKAFSFLCILMVFNLPFRDSFLFSFQPLHCICPFLELGTRTERTEFWESCRLIADASCWCNSVMFFCKFLNVLTFCFMQRWKLWSMSSEILQTVEIRRIETEFILEFVLCITFPSNENVLIS